MMRLKRLAGVLITIALTIYGIARLGYLVRPTDTDGAYSQIQTLHSLPDNSIEVMVYGSSHAFRGLSTMELYEKYGIGAYNYGWHWQKINTTKLFIKDSLLTQTPKVILIECYLVDQVLCDTDLTPEIYYSRYLSDGIGRGEFLKQCFQDNKERYLSYYMPLCAFHDNWNTLTERSFAELTFGTWLRKNMGFSASNETREITIPDYTAFGQAPLSEKAVAELDEIVALCREKDIDIIFYTVPYQGEYKYSNAMDEYAKKNSYKYFDLFKCADEVGFNEKTDFSDAGHLNTSGSIKVADYLGRYIVEHYDITDMRMVEGNIWETAIEN